MKNVLYTWLGNTDYQSIVVNPGKDLGPIAQAIKENGYTDIILLSNYEKERLDNYIKELNRLFDCSVIPYQFSLPSPTHFKSIYKAAATAIEQINNQFGKEKHSTTYHLSPGTPAMAAIWILIANSKYAKELFRALIPLGITWGAQTSFTLTKDAELMDLFVAAGGRYVFIGFESISADTLKSVRKGFNQPRDYAAGIRQLHRRGISVMGSFMFGLDGDDVGTFKRTVDFVNTTKIDVTLYNILTPFPGTKLYQKMERQGRIHDHDWSHYDACRSVFIPQGMTSEELQNGWYWANRETYKLSNILRRVLRPDPGLKRRLAASYVYFLKAYRYCPPPLHPEKYSNPLLPAQ